MTIVKILSQHRNDFSATIECEHCGSRRHLTTGYDDNNYHTNVMPAMCCKFCGKNRAGEVEHTDQVDDLKEMNRKVEDND